MQIKDQIAIITGGGSGLGAATAIFLAEQGAKIALLDVQIERANEVAKQLKGIAIACDVTDPHSAENAMNMIKQQLGIPRICINCAGIAPAKRIVGREGVMPLEDFTRVISINLIGTFNVMRLAAAAMQTAATLNQDGERGVIINTASIAAMEGQIGQAAYSASKGGVAAMTLPAARELAQFGIRVVTIAPGLMETPMLAGLPEKTQQSLHALTPFPKRFGKPEEYAALVAHIIQNTYLNGTVIRLDGSLRMSA